jgi:mannose-6-phosphate isomerase-like protein (cupin superfamily)
MDLKRTLRCQMIRHSLYFILKQLNDKKSKIVIMTNYKEQRPWGEFEVLLDTEYCKVKQITVKPHEALSLQYHKYRSEIWTIVQGEANVQIDNITYNLQKGETINIPLNAVHSIANSNDVDLIFIETQLGSYFGEDDIVRINDKYGRK